MAISPGYKAITEAWANAAPGSRTDPDDPGLMPPIDIADGYPGVVFRSGWRHAAPERDQRGLLPAGTQDSWTSVNTGSCPGTRTWTPYRVA